MAYWVIKCYCNANGRDVFDKEYGRQSNDAKSEFRSVLNGLKDQPTIQGWMRPNGFDRLSGKYRQLGKLIFKARKTKVQHRPIGFFGPGEGEFTLLAWASERGDAWDPPNVRDTALARMNEILKDHTRAHERDF